MPFSIFKQIFSKSRKGNSDKPSSGTISESPHSQSEERGDSPDITNREHVFITHIHAAGVVSGLPFLPSGFHVVIRVDEETMITSCKPVLVDQDSVEWDEEVILPSGRSCPISFKVYASFELGVRLGNGTLLCQYETTVGEVLGHDERLPITFPVRTDLVFPLCSSITITIARRICNIEGFITKESSAISELEQLTDSGHDALLRYRQLQNEADLDDAITFFQCVQDMCPTDHPSRSAVLFNLANAKFIHCQANDLYFDLDVPITLYWDALQLRANGHPDHAQTALELSFALLARFRWKGDQVDRTEARELISRAMELFPAESYGYRAACIALEIAEVTVSVSEMHPGLSLVDSIYSNEVLIPGTHATLQDLEASDPSQPSSSRLAGLGSLVGSRLSNTGDFTDMEERISMLERALQLTPDEDPLKTMQLDYLGSLLLRRFERLGSRADVDRSILLREEAVRITPRGHPDRPGWLNNLVCSLLRRLARFSDLGDIERCVGLTEEAMRLTPDGDGDKPTMMINLGISLTRRFEHLGNQADINKSILVQEEALLLTPDGHPGKPDQLNNLGFSLLLRFEHFGDLEDLYKSIPALEEAIQISPDNHVEKPTMLNNLGQSLSRRFERLGNVADINKSILMRDEALCLTPMDHFNRPGWLSGLAHSLFRRFELLDDLEDLHKSISLCEKALSLTLSSHTDQPVLLNNLGLALSLRFQRTGDISDIDRSIYVSEEAVHLTPHNHPGKFDRLSTLGNVLMRRFERLHDLVDIDKAISAAEEAVRLVPNGHASQPALLNNLGIALLSRFKRTGDVVDIDRSISVSAKAVSLTPDGHPNKPGWLNTLGTTYMEHFKHFHDPSHISAANLHLSTASRAQIGPAYPRFLASCNWISSARLQGDLQALLDAYGTSINLLPQLAWVGLSLSERHRLLLRAADIARDAAATALEAGCPEMAIEWLEQGRSVVWNQFLQLRTPVDELRIKYPALADQFDQISKELEHASACDHNPFCSLSGGTVDAHGASSLEQEVQRHHDLALQREKLLSQICLLPGFSHFSAPKTIEQLAALTHSGPVIYLNASEQRCDALIVMAELGGVIPVSLPNVSCQEVESLQAALHLLLHQGRFIISRDEISRIIPSEANSTLRNFFDMLLGEGGDGNYRAVKAKPQRIEGYTPDQLFQMILAYLWWEVVTPILDALGFSTPPSDDQKKTRIFWCATGPFNHLPVHAAGLYDTVEAGTKLSDFAVSSYIPTLGTLSSSAWSDPNSHSSNIRLAIVPQPLTDGLGVLTSVEEEINHIRTLSICSPFVTLQDSHGTIEDVMEKMKTADWVHFSCHGIQDPRNPLNSGLGLANGRRLKLSDIIQLSRPQGGLAFLSACQTAQGDQYLQEESVHLAAGMLLAGYGGVIATMWAIRDADAPIVTKDVYERLFGDGHKVPDITDAAEALHYAVQHLRKSGVSFTSWVPFIHVGR